MNILLIQKEGIDLYQILLSSETSRLALRFYHPRRTECGMKIAVSSLGSALSLVSELRWYIRRYVRETLFEISESIFCTHPLAHEVYYERAAVLMPSWPHRKKYGFRNGRLSRMTIVTPDADREDCARDRPSSERVIEIWCTEDELGEHIGDEQGETDGDVQ
jgi:hypothetical protein